MPYINTKCIINIFGVKVFKDTENSQLYIKVREKRRRRIFKNK